MENKIKPSLKEEKCSKKKAVELFDKHLLDSLEAGEFSSLAFSHWSTIRTPILRYKNRSYPHQNAR